MDNLDEYLDELGTNPCISIVGDPRLSSYGGKGFERRLRRRVRKRVAHLIKLVKPGKVYVVPNKGVNSLSLRLLSTMGVPTTVVNPYSGYCDNMGILDKLNLSKISKKCNIITLARETPDDLVSELGLIRKTMRFIAERSQLVIYVHGEEKSPEIKESLDALMSVGGGIVICVNYDS
jgi:hypothetical protein